MGSNYSNIRCCACPSESDDMYLLTEVQETYGISLYLCGTCTASANEFSDFLNVVIKSEENLRRLVELNQASEMEAPDGEMEEPDGEMEAPDGETNNNVHSSETDAHASAAYEQVGAAEVEVGINTYNIDSEQSGVPDTMYERVALAPEQLRVFVVEVNDDCFYGIFKYECTVCGRNYFDKAAFQEHMANQHSLNNVTCAEYIWMVLLNFDDVGHILEEYAQKVNTNNEDIHSNEADIPETLPTILISPGQPQVMEVKVVDNFRCGIIKFECTVCESIYLDEVAFQKHMAGHFGYTINNCEEYASVILLKFD